MTRYCDCGRPLVQKPREGNAAFGKRLNCNSAHRGKYHKPAKRARNFGLEHTKNHEAIKVGPGMLGFLYGRPAP